MLALVLPLTCCGQSGSTSMLKSSDLLADATILRSAYEQLHPGLYRYNSKAEMDREFAALNRHLDHDQTLQDAFLAFSEFAAKVRCGHTQANPFNQAKPVVEALFKSPARLPFYFDWIGGHMIVTHDFTPGHVLPPGTDVVGINHVPTSAILTRLLTVTRADGANDSKRVAQLAVNGDSNYETFDLYYPMFFPQQNVTDSPLIRKPKSLKAEVVAVSPLTFEQRIAPIKQREQQRQGGERLSLNGTIWPMGADTCECRLGHSITASGTGNCGSTSTWMRPLSITPPLSSSTFEATKAETM